MHVTANRGPLLDQSAGSSRRKVPDNSYLQESKKVSLSRKKRKQLTLSSLEALPSARTQPRFLGVFTRQDQDLKAP